MMMSPVESRHCCCCFLLYSSLFRCVGMWQQWKFPPGIAAADRHDLVLLRVTIATIDLAAAAVAHHDPVLHRVTVATSDPAAAAVAVHHDPVLHRVTVATSDPAAAAVSAGARLAVDKSTSAPPLNPPGTAAV